MAYQRVGNFALARWFEREGDRAMIEKDGTEDRWRELSDRAWNGDLVKEIDRLELPWDDQSEDDS